MPTVSPRHRSHPVDRYRSRLADLADTAAFGTVVTELTGQDGPWLRTFGRFEPGHRSWATVVVEAVDPQRILTVQIFDRDGGRDGGRDGAPDGAVASRYGPVVITPFPSDSKLPALARVLATRPDADIIRYRPARRCTLRPDRQIDAPFLKLLRRPDDAARLFDEAEMIWRSHGRAELGFDVARPLAVDCDEGWFTQGRVPGDPIRVNADVARDVGAALATLAHSSIRPTTRLTVDDQLARTRRALDKAVRLGPDVAGAVERVTHALSAAHARVAAVTSVPTHGSPHLHQWLLYEGRLGLVDFDRLSVGPAELDAATFLGELDFEAATYAGTYAATGAASGGGAMTAAIVEGYASGGVNLDIEVLELFRTHKWLAKVGRLAQALRPDADGRALDLLARVEQRLACPTSIS